MPSRYPAASADDPSPAVTPSTDAVGGCIGERYQLRSELGRGGMACVYRALDISTGQEVALKQLMPTAALLHAQAAVQLFEHEFRVLTQLSHPRVIRVYDYGVDPKGPFYTMELLDGGDLRERSPLPWREACELILDVCSSLALLHSRGLVHRDVGPRNVRCTRDGRAKLIDFGAMIPMGATALVVGTVPFVAPEAVHGSALDARTDLFSLGATLYYAMTGRLAYDAGSFSQLVEAWTEKPPPPSSLRGDIPAALDHLVLSLISLEPALRPRSASEVTQRLAAIAGIGREESLGLSQAHLVTPLLVGREQPLRELREHLGLARHGRGRALLFSAASGLGRSRMLDACAVEAKLQGACVLRAQGGVDAADFAAARMLAVQLLEAMPSSAKAAAHDAGVFDLLFERSDAQAEPRDAADEAPLALKSFVRPAAERARLSRALSKWFVQVSKRRLVTIVADDAERMDEPSIALLAMLIERVREHALLVVASSAEAESAPSNAAAVGALRERCDTSPLLPLTLHETELLLGSIFGDVPNLALLSARIHSVAAGNPRETIGLSQHLLDHGIIRYHDGFSLPAQLSASELPASADEAFRIRARSLSGLARRLSEVHALSGQTSFTSDDYAIIARDAAPGELSDAIAELVARQILASDGRTYTVVHRAAVEVLCAELSEQRRREHHAALAELCERTGQSVFAAARHLLFAGDYTRSFERMMPRLQKNYDRNELTSEAGITAKQLGDTLALALEVACKLPRPAREQHELRHWLTLVSVASDEALYWQAAPGWRAQLVCDSGLGDWYELAGVLDADERRKLALHAAAKRHAQTDPRDRAYTPEEAIRRLIYYVVLSIAVGARTQDHALLSSLPELLEPFAPLSPLLSAIWNNALATRESNCFRQTEQACARWAKVYDDLAHVGGADAVLVRGIRFAIAHGVGLNEVSMGIEGALRWAEILDAEPMHRVSAMYLRKVLRLQQGDLEGAERCRKQAELLALQARVPQMFTQVLMSELATHYAAWDLTGVQQAADKIAPIALRSPGWRAVLHVADGHVRRLRGDLEGARQAYEQSLLLCTPDPERPERPITAWLMAVAAHAETLLDLNLVSEARDCAERVMAECERRQIRAPAHDVRRALALAEAKLGMFERAVERLEALAAAQLSLGVSGLSLGATYEARARVAIWAGDQEQVECFAKLTAEQYRHGQGSTLGARYQRLMNEARGAGVLMSPDLSQFELSIFGSTEVSARVSAVVKVARCMEGAQDSVARAERALELLCEAGGALGGHLFLVHQGALRLVASRSAAPPDPILVRLTCDYWSQLTDDVDPDTHIGPDDASEQGYAGQRWADEQGQPYRPLALSGHVAGAYAHVGVALLIPGEAAQEREAATQTVAALAGFLVRTGDGTLVGA